MWVSICASAFQVLVTTFSYMPTPNLESSISKNGCEEWVMMTDERPNDYLYVRTKKKVKKFKYIHIKSNVPQ